MTDQEKIEEFKRLYTEEILVNGGSMSPELSQLFDEVLRIFGDNPAKMDALIEEIRNEYYGPEVTLEDRVATLEEKVANIEKHLFG
ncbi:hypothetical protein [Enterococcus casseliflavus]|jgi:hypothetical protein|uniref:hypothetical protein n=1 Tax=Enterococcus casseliflavus TaxID=37734 RepID=UPI0012E2A9F3|nr:hypothetical protein [Enterococcus casseliflavus]MDF2902429.1 hypothetical protein [Bacillus sp. (in: firmicutes)]MUN75242.1 hypothetical protein [Enterococcus casseliflavus]MUN96120.1 hypothetical protein [Enterococcus casseliflavus]